MRQRDLRSIGVLVVHTPVAEVSFFTQPRSQPSGEQHLALLAAGAVGTLVGRLQRDIQLAGPAAHGVFGPAKV